jgi:hypothetical protein
MAEIPRVGNVEKRQIGSSLLEDTTSGLLFDAASCIFDSSSVPTPHRTAAVPSILAMIMFASFALPALGQAANPVASSEPSYLFRIQHARPSEDVCALVRGDGQFHYERDRGDKDTIWEGTLPAAVLENLIRIVSSDELFHLRQENIPQPLMENRDFDLLLLSVLRPGEWQNLRFPTPETRQPFAASLNPLLAWLDSVPKEKHQQLSEFAGRNNCAPPGEVTLRTRPSKSSNAGSSNPIAPASIAHLPQYVLKSVENVYMANQAERTCFLVQDTGSYHMERRSQRYGTHDVESKVIEGALDPPDFAKLKAMLNKPDWKEDVYKEPPTGMQVREGSIAFFDIPRGSEVQKLTFWNFTGAGRSLRTGSAPISQNHPDLLQTYETWLQFSIDTINAKPLPLTAANDCAVQP